MDFDEFESKEQKDFEIFMMRYKPQYRDFSKIGDFTYSNELTSIAYDAYLAGQQSKQAEIKRAVLSLRNEFNLWADDNEQFHAIEAQIEQLEELLK